MTSHRVLVSTWIQGAHVLDHHTINLTYSLFPAGPLITDQHTHTHTHTQLHHLVSRQLERNQETIHSPLHLTHKHLYCGQISWEPLSSHSDQEKSRSELKDLAQGAAFLFFCPSSSKASSRVPDSQGWSEGRKRFIGNFWRASHSQSSASHMLATYPGICSPHRPPICHLSGSALPLGQEAKRRKTLAISTLGSKCLCFSSVKTN